ncbi:MAG: threonine synthase [Chloroflexi bacterium]|nr:MAG: threonine synthase [Chloroflexota bacterium]
MQVWHYTCERCGHIEPADTALWRCPVCGGAFALVGDNDLAGATIETQDTTLWRYCHVLPANRDSAVSLGEGMTPLIRGEIAGREVWFKHDALLPTGSFKDRGAAVLVTHLRSLGIQRVVVDSSGNAAAAMAGYCAAAGLECLVFAPRATSPGKLVQSRAFGAQVHLVSGSRDDVARAAQDAAAADQGAFYASHNWHAVFVEGVKTWAIEVWEQLGRRSPALAVVPTGGGSAFVGGWRGFQAVPSRLPVLVAAQPLACAPLVAAFDAGLTDVAPVAPGTTIAEGTRIGAPARGRQMLAALRESGGWAEAVDETTLAATLKELWAQGLYVEPTAAVGAAAFRLAVERGRALPEGETVILLTGSGLKATETISSLVD